MLIPDLTENQTSTGSREQCPEGWHAMRVGEVSDKKNEKGNTTIFVTWHRIEDGAVARDNFTVLTEGNANVKVGRDRLKGLLSCLGLPFAGTDTNAIVGLVARVRVQHEEFVGRDGNAASSAKAVAYERLAQIPQQPSAPAPTTKHIEDKDIPF